MQDETLLRAIVDCLVELTEASDSVTASRALGRVLRALDARCGDRPEPPHGVGGAAPRLAAAGDGTHPPG